MQQKGAWKPTKYQSFEKPINTDNSLMRLIQKREKERKHN